MRIETQNYYCDNCDKQLKMSRNCLDILTSKREGSSWKRIHVNIYVRTGIHNNATETKADLCQSCATELLTDALKRVKLGERATKGTESSQLEGWN